jgi:hypothetical protein
VLGFGRPKDYYQRMELSELIQKVKDLSLPSGSYVVFGSCPLLLHGIRECDDVDLMVSPEVYEKFKQAGWEEKLHGTDKALLANGVYEVGKDWDFGSYNPTLKELLARTEFFQGVPFASLDDVVKWKTAFGREKDRKDIELIRKYLAEKS